jgi:hypothetical protein
VSTKSAAINHLIDSNAPDFYDRARCIDRAWLVVLALLPVPVTLWSKDIPAKSDRSKPGTAELNRQSFADMDWVKEFATNGVIDGVFDKNPEKRG